MNPIFEQGNGNGIGHNFTTFVKRFIEICENHLNNERADSFAFILYDFHNETLRKILKTEGFTKLDRLSRNKLSIFYLDSKSRSTVEKFNKVILGAFDIEPANNLPFILFFNVFDNDVIDIKIVELETTDSIYLFDELYNSVKEYISKKSMVTKSKNNFAKFFDYTKKLALNKFIDILVDKGIENENIF